jgi:tRNA A-37 threonylcarbamoyl transferase component Bud32
MWLAKSEMVSHARIRELLMQNAPSVLGPTIEDDRVLQVAISGPLYLRGDRSHRILTVKYRKSRTINKKKLWLKCRPQFGTLYEIHTAAYSRLRETRNILPQPYFCAEFDGQSLIAMEFVEGTSLRNLLLRGAVCGRSTALKDVFWKVGAAIRKLHDSSKVSGMKTVGELADNARRVTDQSRYLTSEEKAAVIGNIAVAETRADSHCSLPLIKIHNDCTLRNIVIRTNGSPCFVDLDSMRAPDNSRWYDVGCFLINLESQTKYSLLGHSRIIVNMWKSFWTGYVEKGRPDGLSEKQITALIYLIKVEYLLGGTMRPPLFEVYKGVLASRYLKRLKDALLRRDYITFSASQI